MENPAEVQELRNKLRMMKFPQDEILNTVRRQQRAIHKQKQANETIRNEIDQFEAQLARIEEMKQKYATNETLLKLESQKKNLTNKLSVLQADFSAEDQKRRRLEEEVSKARSKAGGMFAQARENEEMQAKLRTMENKLDKALLRYNNSLAKLAAMRSQIDEMRKDRATFRDVIRRAKSDRESKEQEIGRLIAESNDSYARRDNLKMRLVQIKTAEKESIQAYEERLTRLTETIETQKITKGHTNVPAQPLSQMNSQIGSSSDQQEELTALTESYQTSITQTLDTLQMKDVDQLIQAAEQLERENFSLYNFVVEDGATLATLQEELESLKEKKTELDEQANMTEEEQSECLAKLTDQINEIESELKEKNAQYESEVDEFKQIYEKLEKLFHALNCTWEDAPDAKDHITPANAMWVMSSIEKRIAEIMNTVFDQARIQFATTGQEIKLGTAELETRSDVNLTRMSLSHQRMTADREVIGKAVEATRPLTIEELRELL